jgi:hypothetical protein
MSEALRPLRALADNAGTTADNEGYEMTYTYTKYEWTAFREADLLKSGDTNLGCGDSFVMPASATVCMTTWDNDATLSGDEYCDENATDSSGQLATIDGARRGCQLYAESYHVLKGSDGKTYYLIEIEVEGYDAPGTGDDFFTFYGARPPAGVTLTVTSTCNVSGHWVDYRCLGAGSKVPPNTPPTFTNVPSDGIFCVDENTRLVIDLAASDKDGDALTYEIVGGDDAAFFEIDPATGVLSFKSAPDFEAPADKNGNNSYLVNVKVSDGKGGHEVKCLTVNVCDVPEGGKECIVIEAEDMHLCGYRVECRDSASGDADIVLASAGSTGTASTTFKGAAGIYDMTITYMDENDGKGAIDVFVNGVKVQRIELNKNNNGNGDAHSTFSEITIQDLNLKAGDVITLKGVGNCWEGVRIDKIKICNDEPAPQPGALEGRLFCDENDNSVDDAEPGVGGVTVTLFAADGLTVLATTTTAADGSYAFTGLAAGDYVVGFPTSVDGKVLVDANQGGDDTVDSDASQTTGKTGPVTVVAGQTTKDVDAGVEDPGTAALSGRVFCDENDNDADDAEPGVGGVTVRLISGGMVIATTTTAADGSYSFTGLDAGSYTVEFDAATTGGKVLVGKDLGGDDTIDSDADQTTGRTDAITLAIGETKTDIDAGVEDPRTGAIGDRVWIDANGNGQQDLGEDGKSGVTVQLIAGGMVIATTTTGANGEYLFDGLAAGDYQVRFGGADGFVFTTADSGADDSDSDANQTTGETDTISLGLGETNLTVDAGLVLDNDAPTPADDMAKTCVTDAVTVDALANDTDPDGDALTITAVAGQAIAEGGSVNIDGVTVSLIGGKLVFDGSAAAALVDLNVGEQSTLAYSYTVSDGTAAAVASIEVTFCGSAETLEELCESLPESVNFQIVDENNPIGSSTEAFTLKITGSGDARFDGLEIDAAYCLAAREDYLAGTFGTDIDSAPLLSGNLYCAEEVATDPALADVLTRTGRNGLQGEENLDLITWILNQDFIGQGYTDAEIQGAIWGLTDNTLFVAAGAGESSDARAIYDLAVANGEGYTAGPGGLVALVIDPDAAAEALGHSQPFVIAVAYDSLDCLC